MRKLLLGLISIMLLALAIYMTIYGITIGVLEVNGIPAIQEENAKLDLKISTASKLKNTDYPQNVTLLESAYKKLMTEKDKYEKILALGVDENGLPLNKIQEYEIEKIWITMGNYANKQGVDLKMDVTSNNSISKTYDLKFTVTGGYIQITDFLYDIERDNTLVFKLENFKLIPGSSTEALVGTFVCKDIKLKITENNPTSSSSDDSLESTDKSNTSTTENNSARSTETSTEKDSNT